jgi:hypothetical protein
MPDLRSWIRIGIQGGKNTGSSRIQIRDLGDKESIRSRIRNTVYTTDTAYVCFFVFHKNLFQDEFICHKVRTSSNFLSEIMIES